MKFTKHFICYLNNLLKTQILYVLVFAITICVINIETTTATPENGNTAVKTKPLFSYSEFKTGNGLRVIVLPDHRLPIINHTLIYLVGAAHEQKGEYGVAHYLEHLMFQGTKAYPKGKYDSLIGNNGGYQNATTSHDVTTYTASVPIGVLPLLMKLEADRMVNLDIKDNDISRERNVVEEEYNNQLINASFEHNRKLYTSLYPGHPYGRLVGGTKKDIQSLDRRKAMAFYKRYYTPANAVLILSGDITKEKAKKLTITTYGKIPSSPPSETQQFPLHPISEKRIDSEHKLITRPGISRVYILPPGNKITHKQAAALQVFLSLADSYTGKSYDRLVRKERIAESFSSSINYYRYSTEVSFSAEAAQNISLETLEKEFNTEIETIFNTPVNEQEFTEYMQGIKARQAFWDDNRSSKLSLVAGFIKDGFSPKDALNYYKTLNAITHEEVNRIAPVLFKKREFLTGTLQPPKNKSEKKKAVEQNKLVKRVISKKGIEAWLNETHHAKTISLHFSFKGGAWYEPEKLSGLSSITASLFTKGAGDYDTIKLTRELNKIAASFNAYSGDELFKIGFSTPVEYKKKSLELLKLALYKPRFDPVQIELAKESLRASQELAKVLPSSKLSLEASQKLYKHPILWRPSFGTIESIADIKIKNIIEFRNRMFTRENLKVAASGAITSSQLEDLLDDLFGDLPAKSDLPSIPHPPQTKQYRNHIEMDVPTSQVLMSNLFPAIKDKRTRMAAYLADHIIGDTPNGRLFQHLREKLGLVYGIHTSLSTTGTTGYFAINFSSSTKNRDKVISTTTEILKNFIENGPTETELKNAKSSFLGSFYFGLEGNGNMASRLLSMQEIEHPIDYLANYHELVKSIRIEDIRTTIRQIIKPDSSVIVSIGNNSQNKQSTSE